MRNRRGFLLLETMLSIAIIAGGLLFVMRTYSTYKQAIERSRALLDSSLLLEERIFDLEEAGEIEACSKEGEFEDNKDYLWKIDSVPMEKSNLNLVTIGVSQKRSRTNLYRLTTYLKNASHK